MICQDRRRCPSTRYAEGIRNARNPSFRAPDSFACLLRVRRNRPGAYAPTLTVLRAVDMPGVLVVEVVVVVLVVGVVDVVVVLVMELATG
jgi:hypothetical protein